MIGLVVIHPVSQANNC